MITVFIKRGKNQTEASRIEEYQAYDEIDDNSFLATPFISRLHTTNDVFGGDNLNDQDYDDIVENDFSKTEDSSSNHNTLQHLQLEEELVHGNFEALTDIHGDHGIRIYDASRPRHVYEYITQWDLMCGANMLSFPSTSQDLPQSLHRRAHSYEQIPSLTNWNITEKESCNEQTYGEVDFMAHSTASSSKEARIYPTDVTYERSLTYQYGSLHVYECVPKVNVALQLLLSSPSRNRSVLIASEKNDDETYDHAPNVAITWLVCSNTSFTGPNEKSPTSDNCYDIIQPYERAPIVDFAELINEIACSGKGMAEVYELPHVDIENI